MNKNKELLQIKAIRSLGFDITNTCYQLIKDLEKLKNMYVEDPLKIDQHERSINKLREYITENVIEKYNIEKQTKNTK